MMGSGIQGPPNEYDFGLEFDYSLWTAGTQIDLVSVNWDNNYRDTVKFASQTELDRYIDSLTVSSITLNQLSYVKPNQPVRIPIPHNRAIRYNYLRVRNPRQPIDGDIQKTYYYFILDYNYVAPQTTEIVVQLDVWQTYIYNVTMGNCYVERGHAGIANEKNFQNYGRDYLTVPEGLNLGTDYQTVAVRSNWIMTTNIPWGTNPNPSRYKDYDVLVVSTVDLTADPGTVDAPTLKSATGTNFQSTQQGADFYIFSSAQFDLFLNSITNAPWVSQGIVSVTIIPKITRYHPEFIYSPSPVMGAKAVTLAPKPQGYSMYPNWRADAGYVNNIPDRYKHLNKLKTFPYTAIEMTTYAGQPVVLKPEIWNRPDAPIYERATLVPPNQRIQFMARGYNSRVTDESQNEDLWPNNYAGGFYSGLKGDDQGEWLDVATLIANFPTMTIVNNGQMAYLAANMHSIAFGQQSADWSQQRALAGNQAQYDISTGAMSAAMNNSGSAVNADIASTANQNRTLVAQQIASASEALVSGLISTAKTPILGGIADATTGMTNAGIQTAANDEAVAIRNSQAAQIAITNNKQSQLVRDTNKNVADWAARGDYANTIAGINAKVQDAALIQPTTSGQMGGETLNMVNEGWRVALRWKMIDQAAMRIVGEYWLRYGYAIRAFMRMPASYMVMSRFTYWKLTETYITGAECPEGFKQAIRGIFEKGVTVWADPNDIGNIDLANNAPVSGFSY